MSDKFFWYFVGFILTLVVSLTALFAVKKSAYSVPESHVAVDVPVDRHTQSPVNDAQEDSDLSPLSIRALSKKTYYGGELSPQYVLEKNEQYTRYHITYQSGELTISGIMNVPQGEGPFPVVILNHGYIDPAVYTNGRGLKREQDYLARRGFVVIHPDYRNHAQSSKVATDELETRIGYTEDVINLVYAVKNSPFPYLDRDRVGMMGHSMGGGITQAITVIDPKLVKAVALYAPVSMDYRDSYERWLSRRPETAIRIAETYGLPKDNPAFWDEIAPVNFVDRVSVPLVFHHGTSDADVPIEWSRQTVTVLQDAGKEVAFYEYRGEGHEFGPQWNVFMDRLVKFFQQKL